MPARRFGPWKHKPKAAQEALRGSRPRPHRGARRLGLETLEGRTLLAANLAITPITWNVVGLDSNNVSVGPNEYLIGARITNTGDAAATGVRSGFAFDSGNPYINLDGPASQAVPTLAPGASADVYYNAVITRTSAAYDTTRRYHITATADGVGPVSTPTPREIYVEKILSQSRNSILSIAGPTTVYVGQTYQYNLTAATAPQGYEQLEAEVTFPSSFRILSTTSTYTAPVGATNDKVYADAGGFQNDPTQPNYLEVVGPANYAGGKAGGVIQTTFTVQVLAAGTTNLTSLINDKSGASYHYNADFGLTVLAVTAIDTPPVARDDAATTAEDTPVAVDVLGNDSSPGGNALDRASVAIASGPAHGSVAVNPVTGVVTYTPAPDWNGTDSFQYRVSDAASPPATSNLATATITVTPVNDPPVNAVPPSQFVEQDTTLVFSSAGGNAVAISDPDAGIRPVKVTLTATHGTVALGGTAGLSFLVGDGSAAATLSFTGTLASINAALDGLAFAPSAGFTGAAGLAILTDDLGNTGAGGAKTDSDAIAITVGPVNHPPVNAVPGTQTITQGSTRVFSSANGNAISVSDPDAGTGQVLVTLGVTSGTLTAVPTAGVTISGNGTGALSLAGSIPDIDAALNGLTFAPAAGFSGLATLTVTTNDQGHTGAGGPLTDFDSVTIRVTAVNKPPVNSVPAAQATNENTAKVFSTAGGNAISISDPDADPEPVRVTLSITNGTLTLGGTSGLTFYNGTGTADTSVSFTGTIAAINAALNGLRYTPTANFNGNATLTITTDDLGHSGSGGALSDTDTVTIAVNAVNDPPVNTVPGAQSTRFNVTLGFSATNGNAITVYDPDAGTSPIQVTISALNSGGTALSGAALTVTTGLTGGLAASGISGSGTNVLVLTGSQSQINTTLSTLVFDPSGGNLPDQTLVSLQVVTNDQGNTGTGGAKTATSSIPITILKNNINQPPVNGVPGTQTVNHNTNLVFSSANGNAISTADPDAGVNPVQVTLTATNGTLTLAGTTYLTFTTGTGTNNATMTFTGALGNVNAAMNGLIFTPTSGFSGAATVTITTSDQGNIGTGGAKTDTDSVTVNVTAVNAAPVNSVPAAQFTAEDTAKVFSSANGNAISVSDIDAAISPVKVTLTAANGTLTLSGTSGLTFTSGANGGSSMIFTGTLSAINTALNGLSFLPTANFNGSASLTILTDDLGNTGTGGALTDSDTVNITVTPVNDAPVNGVPAAQTLAEDSSLTFSSANGNAITISDVDAGSATVQVTLAVTNGTLTLGGTAGLTLLDGGGVADASVTFSGTIAAINSAMDGLRFNPSADFAGSAALTITTNDLGNTGSGGPLSDVDTVALTVTPMDDPPVNHVPGRQAVAGGSTVVFSSANGNAISVSDIDAGTGAVKVTLSVNVGTLAAVPTSGVTISGNGTGSVILTGTLAKVNAAMDGLAYSPPSSFGGTATLTVTSVDQGNTGTGGPLTDTDTVTLAVTAANQAPVNAVPASQTVAEDSTLVFSVEGGNAITISDADAGSEAVEVTLAASHGRITLGGIAGLTFVEGDGTEDATLTIQGTIADINAALDGLTFTPSPDFNGAASLTISTNDLGNTGAGGPMTDSDAIGITVSPVNDVPTIAAPGLQEVAEGTPLVFSSAAGNAIAIDDVDAGSGELLVSLQATHGTLSLAGSSGLTFLSGGASGSVSVSFTGTLGAIAAALEGLGFAPDAGYNGPAGLAISVDDRGNTGGGPLSASAAVSIVVDPVNDPPAQVVPSAVQVFDEDTEFTFSAARGNPIAISDPDAGDAEVEVTLAAADGVLTLTSTSGLTFTKGTGEGDAAVVFRGTLDDVNAAIDGLRLTPTANFNGDSYLVVSTNDLGYTGGGGPRRVFDYILLHVNPVDDAPVITAPASVDVDEDTPLVFSGANGLSIDDVDASEGDGIVRVDLVVSHGTMTLGSSIGLTILSGDSGAPGLSVTGTIPDLNAALDGLVYRPDADFNGPDALVLSVNDLGNFGATGPLRASQTIAIAVAPVNDAPVAVDHRYTVAPDETRTVTAPGALAGATDVDGDLLVASLDSEPSHGSVTLNADGSFLYTPDEGYGGADSFTFLVSDGRGGISTATVFLTISAEDPPPRAEDDSATTPQDQPTTIAVLDNDTDPNDDPLTIVSAGTPSHGSTQVNADGTITYTPEAGFVGPDSFTYTISDPSGGRSSATVTVEVTAVNHAPAAKDDTATTDEDTPVVIDPLGNDTDPDEDPLVILSVGAPAHGSVAVNPDGTLTYTPDPNIFGSDRFSYTISDGRGGQSTATVTVTINAVNDPPVAQDDAAETDEDAPVVVAVLSNDTDIEGDALSVVDASTPDHGSVAINADGTLSFTPAAGYWGADRFTYTISDGRGGTATATISVTIAHVNHPPMAPDLDASAEEDGSVLIDVLSGASDPDGDSLAVISSTQPAHGTAVLNEDGTITYTPDPGYAGPDTFTYTISDGHGGTATGAVSVDVSAVNHAPVATDDDVATDEDSPIRIDVLGNDSDPDGDALTVSAVSAPADGTAVLNEDGTITYTPGSRFRGTDSFTYTASDGRGGERIATVRVTVNPVNHAPQVHDVSATLAEDGSLTLDLLASASDPEGDSLTITSLGTPDHGTLTVNPDGTVTYRPSPDYNGVDAFLFTVGDPGGLAATGRVSLTITPVNDAPVVADDFVELLEDTPVVMAVLGDDSDVDGDRLTIVSVTNPAHGAVSVLADGTLSYTPAANYHGADSFSYTASDGHGGEATATVALLIDSVNDAPVVPGLAASTDEDTPVLLDVLAAASDVDGDPLSVVEVGRPAHGSVTILPDGTLRYTPDPEFHGVDSFTYTGSDGHGGMTTATATITVAPVNDAPVANDDSATTPEEAPLVLPASAFVANDTDVDGDALTVIVVGPAGHGAVTLAGGIVTYTPAPLYRGLDSFPYTIDDGHGGRATGLVHVTVSPVNHAPTAADASAITSEGRPVTIDPIASAHDADGDPLHVASTTQGAHGKVVVGPDGTITYTPAPGFSGVDHFAYTISDGQGGTLVRTATVTVRATVGGVVFLDRDADGVRGPGEPGLGGMALVLRDASGKTVGSTTSADDGSYRFTDVAAGSYTVVRSQPGAYGASTPTSRAVSVFSATQKGVDFGETLGTISGHVFDDADDDGRLGRGDRGIAGVTISLVGTDVDGRPVSRTIQTAADGSFAFADLPAGTYDLIESQPAGYLENVTRAGTLGGSPSEDRVSRIAVGPGARGTSYDFGELKPAGAGRRDADPAGFVYVDANNNGAFDPGERPIPGVRMVFTGVDDRGQPVHLEQLTGLDGSYRFDKLRPGRYTIAEVQPAGYLDGKDTLGTTGGTPVADGFADILLGPGQVGEGYNFGEIEPASLTGTVYYDFNRNGELDASDFGIAGALVTLTGADDLGNAIRATSHTDANGHYTFDGLRPGTYAVAEAQVRAFRDGRDALGSLGGSMTNDLASGIVVASGDRGVHYDFGELARPGCRLPRLAVQVGRMMQQMERRRALDPARFDAHHPTISASLARGDVPWGVAPFPRGPLVHRWVPTVGGKVVHPQRSQARGLNATPLGPTCLKRARAGSTRNRAG